MISLEVGGSEEPQLKVKEQNPSPRARAAAITVARHPFHWPLGGLLATQCLHLAH